MLKKEGQIRIPSGCAISGIFCKDGATQNAENITKSIAVMRDRSNGLGGGFAAYGIYPEFKDFYAFHVFFDSKRAKDETEEEAPFIRGQGFRFYCISSISPVSLFTWYSLRSIPLKSNDD